MNSRCLLPNTSHLRRTRDQACYSLTWWDHRYLARCNGQNFPTVESTPMTSNLKSCHLRWTLQHRQWSKRRRWSLINFLLLIQRYQPWIQKGTSWLKNLRTWSTCRNNLTTHFISSDSSRKVRPLCLPSKSSLPQLSNDHSQRSYSHESCLRLLSCIITLMRSDKAIMSSRSMYHVTTTTYWKLWCKDSQR